jgi:HlyD family secretion protein
MIVVVVIAGTLAIAFNRPATAANTTTAHSTASTVGGESVANSIKAIGTFVSAYQTQLSFLVAGRVKEIRVKEGDRVHAGDLILALDSSMLDLQVGQAQSALDAAQARFDQLKNPSPTDVAAAQANVAAAQAALAQLRTPTQNDLKIAKADLDKAQAAVARAQADYDRIGGASNPYIALTQQVLVLQQTTLDYQKASAVYNAKIDPSDSQLKQAQAVVEQTRAQLARLTSPSANDLKTAQAAVMQAQDALEQAKQNVANAKIFAPFDGTVVWIVPHKGEGAAPGIPMATIADLMHMQAQIGVDENALGAIQLGQSAVVSADALPSKMFSGKVSKLGMLATTTAGIISIPVTIDVDPSDVSIAPGLSANVEIQVSK